MMPWILLDVSFLAYRAFHSVGMLEFEDVPTGIIFGFFMQLREICLDPHIRSNKIAIFRDSRTSKRALAYPMYKNRRRVERTPEEIARITCMREQVDMLTTDVLPKIGFKIYHQEGIESDDLMAFAAKRLSFQEKGRGRQAVIVTADGDMYQSITPEVHWFDPQRRSYMTPEGFFALNGIKCEKWGEVKTLAGCSTDNVKGIPGVGKITAIKYLNGELPASHKTHHSILSIMGRKIAQRNRELVVLPHKDTNHFELEVPQFDTTVFLEQCRRFGLESILHEQKAWLSFLEGTPFRTRKRGQL